MEEGSQVESDLKVPWRTVALVAVAIAVCVGTGSLAALVIVAAGHGADGLSTVALALAVLAFTSQLIVFVVQGFAASKQTSRSEEIYTRINGLLEGLKGTTSATQETMERHMSVLLKAAVGEAAQVVESSDERDVRSDRFDPAEFERRVLERAGDVVTDIPKSTFVFTPDSPQPSPEAQAQLDELTTYPSESPESVEAVDALNGLSPWAVQLLAEFGKDEEDSLRHGSQPGLSKLPEAPVTQELVRNGLVELTGEPSSTGAYMARLTSKGRAAAGLIVPIGRPPDWIVERFLGAS